MAELAARAETIKLARELSTEPDQLAFLHRVDPEQLRELRGTISAALFAAHEPKLRRLAAMSKLIPPALAAKITVATLPPMLCGRTAGFLEPPIAARLASHFPPEFLAEVSRFIDPVRTSRIIPALPDELILRVARVLLDRGEYIVLARFVAVVREDLAGQVIAMADGAQLLEASFYAEDRARIDPLMAYVADSVLTDVIRAADELDLFDEAISLLTFLGPDSLARLSQALIAADPSTADGVVAAIVRLRAWTELLPIVGTLSGDAIARLVNVPTTMDPQVISGLLAQVREQQDLIDAARELGYFAMLVSVIDALDAEHRAVLSKVAELDEPELRSWAAELVGVHVDVIDAAIDAFRTGTDLPPELVDALAGAQAAS